FTYATATPAIYTLSLHDALPILGDVCRRRIQVERLAQRPGEVIFRRMHGVGDHRLRETGNVGSANRERTRARRSRRARNQAGIRSEEHTSELQSRENLVCRLLLE